MTSDLVGSLCWSQGLTFWGLPFTEEGDLCSSCWCGLHLFFWLAWLVILTVVGCSCSAWLAPCLSSGSGLRTVSGSRAGDELRGIVCRLGLCEQNRSSSPVRGSLTSSFYWDDSYLSSRKKYFGVGNRNQQQGGLWSVLVTSVTWVWTTEGNPRLMIYCYSFM